MHKFIVIFVIAFLVESCMCKDDWSYFVFAQEWPPAACLEVPSGKHCLIPKNVMDWSIHGLWPTSEKGYPSFCNNSWPFRPHLIEPLVEAMEVKWPNIFANTSEYSFWKHEWSKHGTCSVSEKMFNSEFKYFYESLQLHDEYNVFDYLRTGGLRPDKDNPHMLNFIENAIGQQYNQTFKLFCKNHKGYSSPILTSIYFCFSKNLKPIDCDKIKEPTCKGTYVFYLPFPDSS